MSRGRVGWRTGSPDRLNDLVGAQSWTLFGVAAAPPAPAPAPKPRGPRGWGQVDSKPSFADASAGPTPGEAMRRA